jgi:hypothetical protein
MHPVIIFICIALAFGIVGRIDADSATALAQTSEHSTQTADAGRCRLP